MTDTVPANARCLHCGYRLYGLTEHRCPECGRSFNPLDPTTYETTSKPSFLRKLARPPSLLECAAIMATTASVLIVVSNPAPWISSGVWCLGFPIWCALLWITVVRAYGCRLDSPRATDDRDPEPRGKSRWYVMPLSAAILVSTMFHPWPLKLRFWLSKPAFEANLKALQSGQQVGSGWIGLYEVAKVTPSRGTTGPMIVYFEVDADWADPVGFEYNPNPTRAIGPFDVQVAKDWYTYEH